MNRTYRVVLGMVLSAFLSLPVMAQEAEPVSKVLITNINIFNGKSEELTPAMSVLIEGNKIAKVAASIPASGGMTVIDGGGRTLTPGFIDVHVHLQWNTRPFEFLDSPPDYHAALALFEAKNTLIRGFTTVRDTGGAGSA